MRDTARLAALLLCLLAGACNEQALPPVDDQSVRPARIFQVTAPSAATGHRFVGRVQAAQTVDLSFEVAGTLARLPALEGQTIEQGALVAALDPTDFELAVREAQVQLQLARRDLERKQRLFRERGISRAAIDDAQALHDLREVALARAREDLAKTRLYAPFNATVARRYHDNYVSLRTETPIVRLSDLSELHVKANLPEQMLATANANQVRSLFAEFAFLPGERFELTYRENTGEADSVAQTYGVTFAMPRPDSSNILPGMNATVNIVLHSDAPSIRIPTSALVAGANGTFHVWLFDPTSGAVNAREIELGPLATRGVTVNAGLEGGELIVATGASMLQAGMRVRPLGEPVAEL